MRSFPWAIGALLVVLIAGGVGFFLGVGTNVATVAPVAGTPVVYGWHFFGFPFFGFFFFLLFIFLILAVLRRVVGGGHRDRGWYGAGHGHYGTGTPGGRPNWDSKDIPPMADDMLERWHSRAHGTPEPSASSAPPSPPQQGPTNPTSPSA